MPSHTNMCQIYPGVAAWPAMSMPPDRMHMCCHYCRAQPSILSHTNYEAWENCLVSNQQPSNWPELTASGSKWPHTAPKPGHHFGQQSAFCPDMKPCKQRETGYLGRSNIRI